MRKLCIILRVTVVTLLTASFLQGCTIVFPPNPVKGTQAAGVDAVYYIISIYYLPDRETDAAKAQEKLEGSGYTVNRIPADAELQKRVKGRPSYIYFKDSDFDVMMRLRRELSDVLGEEFNVFRSGPDRADKDMRVILAGKNK
jgi:hypothetical protein